MCPFLPLLWVWHRGLFVSFASWSECGGVQSGCLFEKGHAARPLLLQSYLTWLYSQATLDLSEVAPMPPLISQCRTPSVISCLGWPRLYLDSTDFSLTQPCFPTLLFKHSTLKTICIPSCFSNGFQRPLRVTLSPKMPIWWWTVFSHRLPNSIWEIAVNDFG